MVTVAMTVDATYMQLRMGFWCTSLEKSLCYTTARNIRNDTIHSILQRSKGEYLAISS